jgi:hypothetical protein
VSRVCPTCGAHGAVSETREIASGAVVRRRRKCKVGHRWTTYETLAIGSANGKAGFVVVARHLLANLASAAGAVMAGLQAVPLPEAESEGDARK